jgi:hypothetical protein
MKGEQASSGSGGGATHGPPEAASDGLARHLCQVGGLNQNYVSRSGTLYHIQIEDRGPVLDPVAEREVRRVNLIVYANYGEPNARIIHGRDHDYEDTRSQEHNRRIELEIQALAARAREVIEEREVHRVARIKGIIRGYHLSKDETTKKELEEANALFPFLFSRAWVELKEEKARVAAEAAAPVVPPEGEATTSDVVYPLDPVLREQVLEIERLVGELERDLESLRTLGNADDILVQTCRKLVARAEDSICRPEPSDFTTRRLEMTRNSLLTTWRQVQSRLRGATQ